MPWVRTLATHGGPVCDGRPRPIGLNLHPTGNPLQDGVPIRHGARHPQVGLFGGFAIALPTHSFLPNSGTQVLTRISGHTFLVEPLRPLTFWDYWSGSLALCKAYLKFLTMEQVGARSIASE